MPPTLDEQLKALQKDLAGLKKEFSGLGAELPKSVEQLGRSLEALEERTRSAATKVDSFDARVAALEASIASLGQAVPVTPRKSIQFSDFAQQLHDTIASFNDTKGRGEELKIDSLEVELKSGVELDGGVKLALPAAQELKPESLSAFRFTLRAPTKMRIPE